MDYLVKISLYKRLFITLYNIMYYGHITQFKIIRHIKHGELSILITNHKHDRIRDRPKPVQDVRCHHICPNKTVFIDKGSVR